MITKYYKENDLSHQYYLSYAEYLKSLDFKYLGRGSYRMTFARGNIVIKVPCNPEGLVDNRVEGYTYRKYKSGCNIRGMQFAPCRLLPNGCLMMKKIDNNIERPDLPGWAYRIDNNQVGYYKSKVVAYDFAIDVAERYEPQFYPSKI